jgi:hypothetical protein
MKVREFAIQIANQIHKRMLFEQDRPTLLHQARQGLTEAETDVSAITEAQKQLAEAANNSPHKAKVEQLTRELVDIRSRLGMATQKVG